VLGIELNQTGFVVVDQQNGMEQAHGVVSQEVEEDSIVRASCQRWFALAQSPSSSHLMRVKQGIQQGIHIQQGVKRRAS
jgi:hypothetical protein